ATEHGLVLEERSIAEAIDLQGKHVLACAHVPRDVELRRRPTVLAISDFLSVYPHVERRIHSVEVQQDAATLPSDWNGERAAIGGHGIIVVRRVWVLAVVLERVADVHVDRHPISLGLD